MSWDREGPTRNPRRPNQFPTDHWDGESRSPTYGPAGRLQTFEDPWSRGHQNLRQIVGRTRSLSATCDYVSPNDKITVVSGYQHILTNNTTDTIPSSSPAEWSYFGDSIYCHFDTPLFTPRAATQCPVNLDTDFPQELTDVIVDIGGLRMTVVNNLGDTNGAAINALLWIEQIAVDWTPGITWNTKPPSLYAISADAAGTIPYLSWDGTNQGSFNELGFHGVFDTIMGPSQELSTAASPVDTNQTQCESYKHYFQPGLLIGGPFGNAHNSIIGTPTTTTIRLRGFPMDYVSDAIDMTLETKVYGSAYNASDNFIGSFVRIEPWTGSGRAVAYRKVVGYNGTDGTFTLDSPLPYVPEVGVNAGGGFTGGDIPDYTKTDAAMIAHPIYGVAIHLIARSQPTDGTDPQTFTAALDALSSLSFGLSIHSSATGLPA